MNKTGEYRFTIIVPVYNETDNIYALEKALNEFIPKAATRRVRFLSMMVHLTAAWTAFRKSAHAARTCIISVS